MIRIGRCKCGSKRVDPTYPGFTNIVVLTKSASKYGVLGPYVLANEEGHIFENIWQFSKVYASVPKSVQRYSRFDPTIIWDHPAEVHVKNGCLTPEYMAWRQKGMEAKYPIRYPVGQKDRHKCLYSLKTPTDSRQLSYVGAREEIYLQEYCRLVKKEPLFQELVQFLKKGKNLLIIEVDGPHQESLGYYQEKYGVDSTFIENDTMLATEENLTIMMSDEKHAFGHGYCLAIALMESLS